MAKKKAPTDGGADKKLPDPTQSAHAQQMEEIAKARREHDKQTGNDEAIDLDAIERAQAEADGVDAEVEIAPDPEDPPADPDPEPEPTPDPPADPPSTEEMVDLVIDGVTTQVPKSKVMEQGVRSMQKEISADKKLADATRRQEELDTREAELNKRATSAAAQVAQTEGDDLQLDEAEIASIADALKYGDDKKSTEALTKLVKAVRGAKATKGATLSQAEVQTAIRTELDLVKFESALETVKKPQSEGGYADLFADPILNAAYAAEDKRLSEDPDGRKLPYLDRMKKAGDAVRARLNPTKASSPNNGSSNAQRKAELGDTVTAAGGATRTPQVQKPKSESQRHQESLARMNKDRGRS